MSKWLSRRWAFAALAGAGLAIGFTNRADAESPPKIGTVVSLNIDGKGERQFKVVKNEKQPDGSYLSELKDMKSGETITLYDKPGDAIPAPKGTTQPTEAPSGRSGIFSSPVIPKASLTKEKEQEKERRPFLSRLFGERDKDKTPPVSEPTRAEPNESGRKGIFSRIFGSKKSTTPTMPAAPAIQSGNSAPPPVIPTPRGGLTDPPRVISPVIPQAPASTNEPPRVMPSLRPATPAPTPITPPAPLVSAPSFPVPMPVPTPPVPVSAPAEPAPMTAPTAPTTPTVPDVPSIPVIPIPLPEIPTPPSVGIPPIPVLPEGVSAASPAQAIVPVGYASTTAAPTPMSLAREMQPWAISLQSMTAPSARLTAVRALADGRSRSSDSVKAVLFQAAQTDPCGEVRAACITQLCELGYFDPQFLSYVQFACNDVDPMVRDAASTVCAKMITRK